MSKHQAIVMKEKDNVATVTEDIAAGSDILFNRQAEKITLHVTEKIPFGHKVAICQIEPGEKIIKYGEVIGVATKTILPGQHTHVHNLDGCRGRGDLEK